MKTRSFSFDLPPERIAQQPLTQRDSCRLLLLDRARGRVSHHGFHELPRLLAAGTLVLLNDSRVRKARLFGESPTGGRVEFLLLEQLTPGLWKCLAGRARKQRPGRSYRFPGGVVAVVESCPPGDAPGVGPGAGPGTGPGVEPGVEPGEEAFRCLRFEPPIGEEYLEEHGHVPLPPYIDRADAPADARMYQTVYARALGSAAAPTAGLHLTEALLRELEAGGVTVASLTLHVGAGTFLPIRGESIEEHRMHEERFEIPAVTAEAVNARLARGGPILAVGTTVVRALESAFRSGQVQAGQGSTSLYITPGFRFRVVSQLITNFHTPRSTLLVMVSAFAGRARVLGAYREALERGYRFFSYGDAMLIR